MESGLADTLKKRTIAGCMAAILALYGLLPLGASAADERTQPLRQQDLWDHFKEMVQAGQLEQADSQIRALLKEQPRLAHAHYLLGFVSGYRKDYLQAIASFQTALRLAPGNSDYGVALAGAYADIGNLNAGEAELRGILNLNPKDQAARYWLAYLYYMEKKDISALREAKEVLRLNSRYLPSLLLTGDLLYSASNHAASLEMYKQAQEVAPTREGYFGLARIYSLSADQGEKAIECLNKILERNPADVGALSLAGIVYSQMEKYDLAEHAYREMLKLKPSAEDALVSLGRLLIRTGRTDEGSKLLRRGTQAREQGSRDADKRLAVKTVLLQANEVAKLRKFDDALTKVEQVLQLDGVNSDALALKARVLLEQNNLPVAIDSIQKAIKSNPFFGPHYYLLGLIQVRQGNRSGALKAFQKTLVLDPQSRDAAIRIAELTKK
jgi:tetratricopeptide (TPR) repeat protein